MATCLRALSAAAIAAIGSIPIALNAQSAAPARFEVASIRLSKDPLPGGDVQITPGRFSGKDLALQWLILTAYRIKSGNLKGNLPDWTISQRYDIEAKTAGPSDEEDVLAALQALLQDRFQLKQHRETREEPVYFLRVAKGGIKMPPGSCVPVKKDLPNECYSRTSQGLVQSLDWRGVSMSAAGGVAYRSLAWQLSAGRPVIDQTGLTGTYDVHLRWSRDAAANEPTAPSDPAVPPAPSIFDAVQQQLGLKLEPGRGPVEYMIVDRVEKPSEN